MIEWFLSPKSDQERSIQYAMQLYGLGKTGESIVDRYLDAGDKKLDRSIKQLQGQKLAREQGLDWKDYTSDDAMDVNAGSAAVRYGLDLSKDSKNLSELLPGEKGKVLKRLLEVTKRGLEFQWDANENAAKSLADLMKGAKKGIKAVRYL